MIHHLSYYLALIEREEDKRKFELLYNAFERKMYGKAMTIVHKPHLAEDVLQETFTYVAMHMDKIDDPESDSTLAFLTVVTKHKAYDCLRKEAVREKWHADYEEAEEVPDIDFTEFVGESDLALALKTLPERYQTALVLRYMHRFTAKDIAAMMDCSVSSAEKLVSRGKDMLRKAYAEVKGT